MTVPQGNVRLSYNVGRIRSSVPLRPTFEDDETWCCGTAIAVPYTGFYYILLARKKKAPVWGQIEGKATLFCAAFGGWDVEDAVPYGCISL